MAFIGKNYPDIKQVRQITNAHTTAWMASKEWDSEESFDEYRSRLSKLQKVCEATYGIVRIEFLQDNQFVCLYFLNMQQKRISRSYNIKAGHIHYRVCPAFIHIAWRYNCRGY